MPTRSANANVSNVLLCRLILVLGVVVALFGLDATAVGAPEGVGEGTAQGEVDSVSPPAVERREVPEGFVEMGVLTVAPTEAGHVVLLADRLETVLVPIWIGETEALSIALRLEGEGFRRPLTHDLLDAVLREVGADLVEVRIDSLQASTFVASLFIQHGDRQILLDARASDAIALALGNRVPIFVSTRVVDETGIRPGELSVPPHAPGEHAPSLRDPAQQQTPL